MTPMDEPPQAQPETAGAAFDRLVELMRSLLAVNGCPWDREQKLASLRQYVQEEAQEVVAAIDRLLEVEARIREQAGLPPANPQPPAGFSTSHEAKGRMHAHHPAQAGFDQLASASGAPLILAAAPPQLYAEWEAAKNQLVSELGDLLLQPVFQGDLSAKLGYFTLRDISNASCAKLVRRHPHVFGSSTAETAEQVLDSWEELKRRERAGEAG